MSSSLMVLNLIALSLIVYPGAMYILCLQILICLGALVWYRRNSTSGLRMPPGPPPLPIVGNLLDIPRKREAYAYSAMADKYGEEG